MVVRRQYAIDAIEAAVITGVTEHGDDFVLSVERAEVELPDSRVADRLADDTTVR